MENRVGDNIPTAAQVQDWATRLDKLFAEMKPYIIKLNPDEKQHLAQFRPGGEVIVALVANLADKYGIAIRDMPTDGMRSDLLLSQVIAPLQSQVGLITSWLEDTIGAARSEAWQAATGNYSVLSRVAEANASLLKELKPARAFFAKRRKNGAPAAEEDAGTTDGQEAQDTGDKATGTTAGSTTSGSTTAGGATAGGTTAGGTTAGGTTAGGTTAGGTTAGGKSG